MVGYARWIPFRQLSGGIPVWQAWLRLGGEAWIASLSSPHVYVFWDTYCPVDETRQDSARAPPSLFRRREQNRRSHVCRIQLQHLVHKSSRDGRPFSRGAA